MNPLQQDFHCLRCAGTPWCLILTPDYRECMRSLCKVLAEQDDPPSFWGWDCLQGHRCLSEASLTSLLGSPDDTVQAPALLLKKALDLPANSVLFFIVPKNDMVEDAAVIQGIANLRNEFKATRRTLVILARDAALPSFLADDVPVLRDPLPGPDEIKGIFKRVLFPRHQGLCFGPGEMQQQRFALFDIAGNFLVAAGLARLPLQGFGLAVHLTKNIVQPL